MKAFVKELGRSIKSGLPFGLSKSNVKNELGKNLVYNTLQEAEAAGKDFVIGENSILFPQNISLQKNLQSHNISSPTIAFWRANFIDLDNPKFVWEWDEAKKLIRATSWYQELGPPPIHGVFIMDFYNKKVHWADRDDPNFSIYMTFDTSVSTNMIYENTPRSFMWRDFKLYFCGYTNGGVYIVDFLEDTCTSYNNTGMYYYKGNITQRNSGNDRVLVADGQPSGGISNKIGGSNVLYAVGVVRDPNGRLDSLGRPLHYWTCNDGDTSNHVYNPVNGDSSIYLRNAGLFGNGLNRFTGGAFGVGDISVAFSDHDGAGTYSVKEYNDISRFNYEDRREDQGITTSGNSSNRPLRTDGSLVLCQMGSIYPNNIAVSDGDSYLGGKLIITAYGGSTNTIPYHTAICHRNILEGFGHTDGDGGTYRGRNNGGNILIGTQTPLPYMKGRVIVAYPMENGTDYSGNGSAYNYNLVTSIGSGPTFYSTGGPLGGYVEFDGTTGLQSTVSTDMLSSAERGMTISAYVYITPDGNYFSAPIGAFWTNGTRNINLYCETDGTGNLVALNFARWTGSSVIGVASEQSTLLANKWHHVVGVYDGLKNGGQMSLYINGVRIGILTNAGTSLVSSNPGFYSGCDLDSPYSGTTYGTAAYLRGRVANLTATLSVWTEEEIKAEYERMVLGLSGNVETKLDATHIYCTEGIAIDPDSEYAIIVSSNSSRTDQTINLINKRNGLIYQKTNVTGNINFNAVDIMTMPGHDQPIYLYGSQNDGTGNFPLVISSPSTQNIGKD